MGEPKFLEWCECGHAGIAHIDGLKRCTAHIGRYTCQCRGFVAAPPVVVPVDAPPCNVCGGENIGFCSACRPYGDAEQLDYILRSERKALDDTITGLRSRLTAVEQELDEERETRKDLDEDLIRVSALLLKHDGAREGQFDSVSKHLADYFSRAAARSSSDQEGR